MAAAFRLLVTSGFQRDLKALLKSAPHLSSEVRRLVQVLEEDPMNRSRQHPIKKLVGVPVGKWRVRAGDYRLRYDIAGNDVILYSIRHRRDAY